MRTMFLQKHPPSVFLNHRGGGYILKIWTYEEMLLAIQSMTQEEKDRLLTMLLRDEAVMIMAKKETE